MGKQPESRLSRLIQKALKERGAWCYKVWGNELTPAGIPDIVGVYKGYFIGIETKMPAGGNPTAIQEYRAGKIRESGGLVLSPCRSVREALEMLDHIDSTHRSWCVVDSRQSSCQYLGEK